MERNGDPPRTRTENLLIKSQLLCQIELAGRAEIIAYPESAPHLPWLSRPMRYWGRPTRRIRSWVIDTS